MSAAVEVESADPAPDVEGVPAAQLKAVYEEHLDCDPCMFAERIGIDYRYLQRKFDEPVIGLSLAEAICDGLDLTVATLVHWGELTVVPMRRSVNAAKRMLAEEIGLAVEELGLPAPSKQAQERRIQELLADYDTHVALNEKVLARRKRDLARKQAKKGSTAVEPSLAED